MISKRIKATCAVSFLAIGLVGCSPSKMKYDGKTRPVSEVEDIISDKLEVENPDMDLEVNIYEEDDSSKAKNKKKH